MDQNIKQRLVGIAIIFALAVIFLPMILDGSGVRKKTLKVDIPAQSVIPANETFDQKIIELHAKVDKVPELQSHFVDEHSTNQKNSIVRKAVEPVEAVQADPAEKTTQPKVSKAPAEPSTDAKPPVGGDSWVLQVGSFKDQKKALAQRDKLRKSRIAAVFIEQFENGGQISYRVRLGPFLNTDQSKVAQNKIRAKYDIQALIMKYER